MAKGNGKSKSRSAKNLDFWGYRRENGRVGVRNHVLILPVDDISNAAVAAIKAGMDDAPGVALHLKIDDYWRPQFVLQPAGGDEVTAESNEIGRAHV